MVNQLRHPHARHQLAARAAIAVLAVCAAVPWSGRAAEPAFVIDLPGGGLLPGEFGRAEAGDGPRETLPWRAPQFAAPLEFRIDGINGIRGTATAAAAVRPDGFSCRLRGGDVIDGELREIDATHVVLGMPGGEPVRIARAMVTGLGRRTEGNAAGYVGPGGLVGWEQTPKSSWRDEAGRIACDVPNAAVTRDVGGSGRARYDIILSWRKQPELSLSVAAGDGKRPDPFRFEMLSAGAADPVAMLIRQEKAGGKLEPVPLPDGDRSRLRLTLFVDQRVGRLVSAVEGAEGLVDITAAPDASRAASPRFRLQVISGDVCLERLRVTEWKSPDPKGGDPGATQVVLRDGGLLEGDVVALEAGGQLVVRTADGEQQRPLDSLESIAFALADDGPEQGGAADAAAEKASVRVVRRSGGVLSGEIVAVGEDGLAVTRPGLDRPVSVPFSDLQSLLSLASAEPQPLPGRSGTLKIAGAEVPGCLTDGAAGAGGLAWQPRGSVVASPLAGPQAEVSAVVEYVAAPAAVEQVDGQVEIGGIGAAVNQDEEGFFIITMLSEEGAAARDGRIEPGDRIVAVRPIKDGPFIETKGQELAAVMNLLRGRVGTPVGLRIVRPGDGEPKPQPIDLVRGLIYVAEREVLEQALAEHTRLTAGQVGAADQAGAFPSLLVLRSGDVVPVAVERIDAAGVRLRSPVTASDGREAVTVANELVRAIELDPAAGSGRISPDRFKRLTTLPRSQRDDPPTHLLRLGSEDYLRGRLVSLGDDEVVFNVLGQPKRLPRAAVARIIWLHPDEIDFAAGGGTPPERNRDDDAEPRPADAPDGLLVQGVAPGGRTTLVADRLEGPAIVGQSLAFGPSRIDTARIDKLLIGRAVGAGDEQLPFAQWRLRLAPLPRALREEK